MSMTHVQIIEEIKQLSPEDKKALLDEIFQIVRHETFVPRKGFVEQLNGIAKPEFGTRDESQDSQTLSISQRLYGILQFDGEPPNDEEVKDLITDYLIRKYS
jgi:hypothetical protein